MSWYLLAKHSTEMKKLDLKRWGKLHHIIATNLDIDINNDLNAFIEISDIMRDLVDQLERLPRYTEFLEIWKQRHPEFRTKTARCTGCRRSIV